jgi:hypothetical protein
MPWARRHFARLTRAWIRAEPDAAEPALAVVDDDLFDDPPHAASPTAVRQILASTLRRI